MTDLRRKVPEPLSAPGGADRMPSRWKVTLTAPCRTTTGKVFDIVFSDISIDGCCVSTSNQGLEVGQSVVVRPANLESLMCVVCWVDQYRAGLKFAYPLYVPVLEDLVTRYGTDEAKRSIMKYRDHWFGAHQMPGSRPDMPLRSV